jgi:hypothetical protein
MSSPPFRWWGQKETWSSPASHLAQGSVSTLGWTGRERPQSPRATPNLLPSFLTPPPRKLSLLSSHPPCVSVFLSCLSQSILTQDPPSPHSWEHQTYCTLIGDIIIAEKNMNLYQQSFGSSPCYVLYCYLDSNVHQSSRSPATTLCQKLPQSMMGFWSYLLSSLMIRLTVTVWLIGHDDGLHSDTSCRV